MRLILLTGVACLLIATGAFAEEDALSDNGRDMLGVKVWNTNDSKILSIYNNGKLDGVLSENWENGQLRQQGRFVDGTPHGAWHWYHENGRLAQVGHFRNGKKDGLWQKYDENGHLISEEAYRLGNIIQ